MSKDFEEQDNSKERQGTVESVTAKKLGDAEEELRQAIASLEKSVCELTSSAAELAEQVKTLLSAASASKVIIKIGNRVVAEIPVALGAAGGLLLTLAAILISKTVIELERTSTDAPDA